MPSSSPQLKSIHLATILAILAPVAYIAGRLFAGDSITALGPAVAGGTASIALGAIIGIPVGLVFGSLRSPAPAPQPDSHGSDHSREREVLAQVRRELMEIRRMFEDRVGNTASLARITYPTSSWTSLQASGQLSVVQDLDLLSQIARAYYWVDQANHIESSAFESKYSTMVVDGRPLAENLLGEARLLDGALKTNLDGAISAIDAALA